MAKVLSACLTTALLFARRARLVGRNLVLETQISSNGWYQARSRFAETVDLLN